MKIIYSIGISLLSSLSSLFIFGSTAVGALGSPGSMSDVYASNMRFYILSIANLILFLIAIYFFIKADYDLNQRGWRGVVFLFASVLTLIPSGIISIFLFYITLST